MPSLPILALWTRVPLLLLLASTGFLLASCAMPAGPQARVTRTASAEALAQQPMARMSVSEMRGRAWLQRNGREQTLEVGSTVDENQPIRVGAGSIVRLQLGDQAQFELAPNSRLVVHRLPRQGSGDARATWLRLEQGYLRIRWKGALMDPPMQVSFGIWAARLKPGEYFFDTRGRVAAACASDGSMRLSGVPEWTPQGPLQNCLRLEANKAPLAIVIDDAQWSAVRAQRRLHPTLAQAARSRSSAAIARLERDQVRSPGPRPPVAEVPAQTQAPARAVRPPVAAAPRTPIAAPPPTPPSETAARDRTADELLREAESVRNAPRPPDPVTPAPSLPLALGPEPAGSPLAPLPELTRRPPPIAPPPPPPLPPPPPPPPEPEYEPPTPYVQHIPPVIVIPAEPEPDTTPVPPPAPPPDDDEPRIVVVEPPRAQHTPPVIVIPAEPEPAPVPPAPPLSPPPPPVIQTPPPPAPPPIAGPIPVPRTAPVITIPAEPEPLAMAAAPAPPPPPAPPPASRDEPASPAIELAPQSPVVLPPPSQPLPSDSAPRLRGATPPSVPLDIAMYSVAAMPDRVEGNESALIVPPTITHEPARSQWLVNIASYPTAASAQDHARLLAKQKLRAGVREQALPDRMSYLVVIEGFPTEEAAETAAIDLEAHFDLDPY